MVVVYRHFLRVLDVLVSLQPEWIKLPLEATADERVRRNPKYMAFRNVRHAGDGTHIPAIVPEALKARFRSRKGTCYLVLVMMYN